jgi:hypothetical protein
LYKPRRKKRRVDSHTEYVLVDCRHNEGTKSVGKNGMLAKDMNIFLENKMPNSSGRITFGQIDLDKAMKKAEKYGLYMVLLFTSKPKTSPLVKFLSTEFRPLILLVEIPPSTNNQPLLKKCGMDNKDSFTSFLYSK